jgi:hypothetical protein
MMFVGEIANWAAGPGGGDPPGPGGGDRTPAGDRP